MRNLEIWKNGISIVKTIYNVLKDYPTEEKFGLIS